MDFHAILRFILKLAIQYQMQQLIGCVASLWFVAFDRPVVFVFELVVIFARFQITDDLIERLAAKNIDAEELICLTESMVLSKIWGEGAETLAKARFDPL